MANLEKLNIEYLEKEENNLYKVAKIFGYKDKKIEETTKEYDYAKAINENKEIKEVINATKCIIIESKKEVKNNQSYIEFLEELFLKNLKDKTKKALLDYKNQEFEKEKQEKLNAFEQEIEEKL